MNNLELVNYVKKALAEGWGYVWGTWGQVLTPDVFAEKVRQYPQGVGNYFDFIKTHWVNKKVADCVGLIKGAYWGGHYNDTTDVTADSMYSLASEKGAIATMPDIPGVCVSMPGHIGVYIGNGQVIEAHGTTYGVIQTPLHGGTPWTRWCKCPYIQYVATPAPIPASVGKVANPRATKLQIALNAGGFRDNEGHMLDVDGDPGKLTHEAMAKVALRPGSINAVVGFVQSSLNEHTGYHVGVDNNYANPATPPHYHETYDALGQWQGSHPNLVKDYVIGINTLNSLL